MRCQSPYALVTYPSGAFSIVTEEQGSPECIGKVWYEERALTGSGMKSSVRRAPPKLNAATQWTSNQAVNSAVTECHPLKTLYGPVHSHAASRITQQQVCLASQGIG